MIKINGVNSTTLGVTFESGTLEQLEQLPPVKAPAVFGSRHIDGYKVDARNRKVELQELQIPIFLQGKGRADYKAKKAALFNLLRTGKGNTGITELTYEDTTWRLVYDSSEPLRIFREDYSRILLNFTEYNPNDRSLTI